MKVFPIQNTSIKTPNISGKTQEIFFSVNNLLRNCCFWKQRTLPTGHKLPQAWISRERNL